MFSKQKEIPPKPTVVSTPAPVPVSPDQLKARTKAASLISEGITVVGGVVGEGELQIDGVVRGDVRVARLTVGNTGHIEGSVYAEATEIHGRVTGSVTAKQVRLYATAYVDGDITHEQLAMETGAFFQGRSLKFQRPKGQGPGQGQPPNAGQALPLGGFPSRPTE